MLLAVADRDKTPVRRFATAICPHCRRRRKVMPSGLLELHPIVGRWKTSPCRGSGERVRK